MRSIWNSYLSFRKISFFFSKKHQARSTVTTKNKFNLTKNLHRGDAGGKWVGKIKLVKIESGA